MLLEFAGKGTDNLILYSYLIFQLLLFIHNNIMYMTTYVCNIHCPYAGEWKPVEMLELLKVLEPLSADWEDLVFNLIKKDQATLRGHHHLVAMYI